MIRNTSKTVYPVGPLVHALLSAGYTLAMQNIAEAAKRNQQGK